LAKEQNLEWPEILPRDDGSPADSDSAWVSFVINLDNARRTHSRLNANNLSDDTEGFEQEKQYQEQVAAMAAAFSKYRTELLGGKAKAAIIQLVNPSQEEADAYIHDVVVFFQDKVLKLSSAGAAFVGNLFLSTAIMIIGLYFFLLDGPKMIEAFKGLSPIDDAHEQELVTEFSNISRAVVLATLLSALAQGLLAGIGFYFVGLDSVFLLMVLSAVLAMVPFVGAAAVWIPCAFYLYFVDHNLAAAIGLAIYGAAIISMADNIIKPFVLHGQSNIHPLFALLSVLGGVTTLGPIGILVGPMVVAFLQTLLKILQREMKSMDGVIGT
jgi:predicted PurR-regulated permease PerM